MGFNTIVLTAILAAGVLQDVKCSKGAAYSRPTYAKEGYTSNVASHDQEKYGEYNPNVPSYGLHNYKGHGDSINNKYPQNVPTHGSGSYGANDKQASAGYVSNVPSYGHSGYGSDRAGRYNPHIPNYTPSNYGSGFSSDRYVSNVPIHGQDNYRPSNYRSGFGSDRYVSNLPIYGQDNYGGNVDYTSGAHAPNFPAYVPVGNGGSGVFRRGEFISQIPDCGQNVYGGYGSYGKLPGRVPIPNYGDASYSDYGYGGSHCAEGQGSLFPFNSQVGAPPYLGYGSYRGNGQIYPFGNVGYGQQDRYPFLSFGRPGNVGHGHFVPHSGYTGYYGWNPQYLSSVLQG